MLPSRNADGSCSSDTPSLCKPTKMRSFTGEFSILLFLTLGVCPHTQQVSSDGRAADRDAMPHSLHQHLTNFLRVFARDYAFIHFFISKVATCGHVTIVGHYSTGSVGWCLMSHGCHPTGRDPSRSVGRSGSFGDH